MSLPFGTVYTLGGDGAQKGVPFEAKIYVGEGRLLHHRATVTPEYSAPNINGDATVKNMVVDNFHQGPEWGDELAREYQLTGLDPFWELSNGRRPTKEECGRFKIRVEPVGGGGAIEVTASIDALGQKMVVLNCSMLLQFFAYETIGMARYNPESLKRVDFR